VMFCGMVLVPSSRVSATLGAGFADAVKPAALDQRPAGAGAGNSAELIPMSQ
jgi:uncharacterized spore protein YtfJ